MRSLVLSFKFLYISAGGSCVRCLDDTEPDAQPDCSLPRGLAECRGPTGRLLQGKPDLDPELLKKHQTQELQHGRLAMLATMELLLHDWQNLVVPGFDGYDNLITGLPFLCN